MDLKTKVDGFTLISDKKLHEIKNLMKYVEDTHLIGSMARMCRLLQNVEKMIAEIKNGDDVGKGTDTR